MSRRGRPQIQVRADQAMIDAYRELARAADQELAPYVRGQLAALLPHLQAGLAITPPKD